MFYARIREMGKQEKNQFGIIGAHSHDQTTLEDLWPYIQRNLQNYLMPWQMPSCPPYISAMELLKHITPEDEKYICTAKTGAVFCWRFFTDRYYSQQTPYILEVWASDVDYALPKEYHQKSED